tara:strand:- start:272 stop:589 length:318 start_codon:yes stop_codon:yes gene_type:complete
VGKKADNVTVQKRLAKLLELHNKGYSRFEMVQFCSEHYGLSSRMTDKYRKALFDQLRKDLDTTREAKVTEMITRLDHVYKEAVASKQLSNSIGALNSISRLLKLE